MDGQAVGILLLVISFGAVAVVWATRGRPELRPVRTAAAIATIGTLGLLAALVSLSIARAYSGGIGN